MKCIKGIFDWIQKITHSFVCEEAIFMGLAFYFFCLLPGKD
jgi:hypothetical protein